MAFRFRCSSSSASAPAFTFNSNLIVKQSFSSSTSISIRNPKPYPTLTTICRAAKSVNNQKTSSSKKNSKKKKKKKKNSVVEFDGSENSSKDYEILKELPVDSGFQNVDIGSENSSKDYEVLKELPVDSGFQNVDIGLDSSLKYDDDDMLLPRPPYGFLVDDDGVASVTSTDRIVTIIDPESNLPLDCLIRRVFKSSERVECMFVSPVDTPVYILKVTRDGMSPVNDEDVESVLPAAAFALAKIGMHFVYSGYLYTARGGFCYTEKDILEFHTDEGEDIEGLLTGVQITYFELEGTAHLICTTSKPLQYVVVKGENGQFQLADDDILDDYAVMDAIDEETEFNALVVEEAAFIEALLNDDENDIEALLNDGENDSENEI